MASTKQIKQRIRSTKNTAQVTKAMEVVSATKMRKSQDFAIRARPYALASLEMLQNLLARTPELPPLLRAREVKKSLLLVVTSDKGLAGAFNANAIKKTEQWIAAKKAEGKPYALCIVGKKAKDYFERRGEEIFKTFWGFGDFISLQETSPVARELLSGFSGGAFDEVEAVYTNFRTTLLQETALKKILPATEEGIAEAARGILPERGKFAEEAKPPILNPQPYSYEYKFEPSPAEILEILVPHLLEMQVHHIILESNASEHSARMVAMKSASDNARELISDLTLIYNKARQANITREIVEITAGKEALEQ